MYLAGGGRPDFRTLARFRRDNAAAFTVIFRETVVLALRLGLARLGHVALDGTKLKANTSKHKAMSCGRMRQREAQLREELARLVERAEVQDADEDREYGADSDGYSVAEELAFRAARLAKIRVLRERLEAEQRAEQGPPEDAAPAIGDAAAPVPLPTALSAAAAHRGPDHAPPVTQPPRPRGPVPARRGGSAGRIGCET